MAVFFACGLGTGPVGAVNVVADETVQGSQPLPGLPAGPRVTRCVMPSVTASGRSDRRRRVIPDPTSPDTNVPVGVSWPAAFTSALRIALHPRQRLCTFRAFYRGPANRSGYFIGMLSFSLVSLQTRGNDAEIQALRDVGTLLASPGLLFPPQRCGLPGIPDRGCAPSEHCYRCPETVQAALFIMQAQRKSSNKAIGGRRKAEGGSRVL